MAYNPIHAWKRKDKLPSKDPQKIIYGEQLQDEFDAISKGIGDLEGQIDNIEIGEGGGSTGGSCSWDEISGKPSTYPPSLHTHPISQVDGLDNRLEGIDDSIGDLEGAVGSLATQLAFGGSYDASTGLVLKGNLSEFEANFPLPSHSTVPNTFVIVAKAGDNPTDLDEGDWLVAGELDWVPIKYGTAGAVDWDNIQNKPQFDNYQYWQYKIDGFNTTNVQSTQHIDFQSGDNISIEQDGYAIKISAVGGEIDTSNFVQKDKQNLVNYNFYLHNADFSFLIDEYEVHAPIIAGNSVVAADSSFLPRKDGSFKYERHAFQVLRGDGSNPMYVTHDGVVQAQDYLDADGNSIIGAGGDPEWAFVGKSENDGGNEAVWIGYWRQEKPYVFLYSVSIGYYSNVGMNGVAVGWKSNTGELGIAIGSEARSQGWCATAVGANSNASAQQSIALGYGAEATKDFEFAIPSSIKEVNFSGATVQATDYLDANGNSIIGSGGGGDVDLTGYATQTWVSTNYQVKGNYLTSSSLNGYATQTWVGQNYQPKGQLPDRRVTESDSTVRLLGKVNHAG